MEGGAAGLTSLLLRGTNPAERITNPVERITNPVERVQRSATMRYTFITLLFS